ncbi:MAG: protein kinase [Deltaproteobacteria bacterium]|nr:protein kinase [Deltaproteobacteria bacterium]
MKKFGQFSVCGLLGKGGMGAVYLARHDVIDTLVALKVLAPSPFLEALIPLPRLCELFVNEAKIMGRIRHPHVLSAFYLDFEKGLPYFAMPFHARNLGEVMGETYDAETESRIIRPDRAMKYALETLSGLACLHDFGVVHRDIKPFNILLSDSNRVKIADFGLSRLRGEIFQRPDNLKVGSPYYAAPEQENDPDAAGPAADLYAVGVMLFRMITGKLPEGNIDGIEGLGPAWRDFFATTLDARPDRRFSSARAMAETLGGLRRAWIENQEAACRLEIGEGPQERPQTAASEIRPEPVKVSAAKAREFFGLDLLWRPVSKNLDDKRFADNGDGTVTDLSTGLLWQKGGTDYPGDFGQVREYGEKMNAELFAGRSNWRIPTVDELKTLASPAGKTDDFCASPVFSPVQNRLWSSDRATFTAFWCVSLDLGYVFRQNFSAPCFTRLVSGS